MNERYVQDGYADGREWSDTLSEHWHVTLVIMLFGPFSLVHAMVAHYCVMDCNDRHVKTDFERVGSIWLINSLVWCIAILLVVP